MNATIKTFKSEATAHDIARVRNGRGRRVEWVVVEGPDDSEWSVMSLRDATENGFCYAWSGK